MQFWGVWVIILCTPIFTKNTVKKNFLPMKEEQRIILLKQNPINKENFFAWEFIEIMGGLHPSTPTNNSSH